MPRKLTPSDKNEFTIVDSFGNELTVFHRMPDITERVRFSNELYKITNKNITKYPEAYAKFGFMIISGIKDGDFIDANDKPISSDPNSKDYREDWKELIENYAPEIGMFLGQKIFESTKIKTNGNLQSEFEVAVNVDVNEEGKKKISS